MSGCCYSIRRMSVEPARFLRRDGPLAPFGSPSFRRLWTAGILFSLGQVMERTAIGWFVLDVTGSVFLTALAWAVRSIPNIFFGPIAGALADRYSRRVLLAANAGVRAATVTVLGIVAFAGEEAILQILVLVGLSGATMTVQTAALQSLAGDVAGPGRLASAISLLSFGGPLHGRPRGPCERLSDLRNWCTADLPFRGRTARISGRCCSPPCLPRRAHHRTPGSLPMCSRGCRRSFASRSSRFCSG